MNNREQQVSSPAQSGKRIVFFVPEWAAGSSSVAHSRILSMARQMQLSGCECLYIGCETSLAKAQQAERLISATYGITAIIEPLLLKPGFIGLWQSALQLRQRTQQRLLDFKPTHIYAQVIMSAYCARALARATDSIAVFDVQGILAAEVAMRRGKTSPWVWLIRALENHEIKSAQRIACVSHKMRMYIQQYVGRDDAIVIPSCFDEKKIYFDGAARQAIRAEYGWDDTHTVLIYSGGTAIWQRLPDIIDVFAAMYALDSSYRFLCMTPDVTEMRALLEASGLSAAVYVVGSCLQTEIYRYLSGADLGIVMRADDVVNNVSSPMKIAEYLGAGLPLVLTQGIGDYSELVPQNGLGIVVDEQEPVGQQIIDFMRTTWDASLQRRLDVVAFSRDNFSVQANAEQYNQLFF